MSKIKRLSISGFRGIPILLDLQLHRDGEGCSAVVYGENGTGKSSITDSWEWFWSKKIDHLAREGAKEQAYPHLLAQNNSIFVEVEFSASNLNVLRLKFDRNRITQPEEMGNFSAMRSLIRHPCHLRFGDLTRFVYQTKTDRFDALAKLMGFVPQVDYQKTLRKVENRLDDEIKKNTTILQDTNKTLCAAASIDSVNESVLMTAMANKITGVGVPCSASRSDVQDKISILQEKIAKDPIAKQLYKLQVIKEQIAKISLPQSLVVELKEYTNSLIPFKEREDDISNILRLELYRTGEKVIAQTLKTDLCPLCEKKYEGNLLEHIHSHVAILSELKAKFDTLEAKRSKLYSAVNEIVTFDGSIQRIKSGSVWNDSGLDENIFPTVGIEIDQLITQLKALIQKPLVSIDSLIIRELHSSIDSLAASHTLWCDQILEASRRVQTQIVELEQDTTCAQMVEIHSKVQEQLNIWATLCDKGRALESLINVRESYGALVEDYVAKSNADVGERFMRISTQVEQYFNVLEAKTVGIGSATLRLIHDQERSVVLEVAFHGQTVSPSYKFLSESQLNSFGLAVFLASVKEFNRDFKFLILDDVVNSFDAYKRPQVIKLIRDYFGDYQILLLTHDPLWRDHLYRNFSHWVKKEFYGFTHQVGPCLRDGTETAERVKELCREDRAVEAGAMLGRYMEGCLYEVCEAFEVFVKFRKRNDSTLNTLLDRFRDRVKSKLSQSHPLSVLLDQVMGNSVFRNFCVHWRETPTQYSWQEIDEILEEWIKVEKMVFCQKVDCGSILSYSDKSEIFVCPCGQSTLYRCA